MIDPLIQLLQKNTFDWLPTFNIRRSSRAKRLQLRFSYIIGFEIVLPKRISYSTVIEFVQQKRNWIEKQRPVLSPFLKDEKSVDLPTKISLLAIEEIWTVTYEETTEHKKPSIVHQDHHLFVFGEANRDKIKPLLIKWLKKKSYQVFSELLPCISQEIGLSYKKLNIKQHKTLWGSCTVDKTINLSMYLLFLPQRLVRYVLIHELCHTVYLNHSSQFWNLVSIFDTNYKIHAKETRKAMSYIPQWAI